MTDKYNLPGYSAKANILRAIDDAASQLGSTKSRQGGIRDIGAKSTAKNILNNNKSNDRQFKTSDLEKLN